MGNPVAYQRDLNAALALFAVAFVVYLNGRFVVAWDLMSYLVYADNIVHGRGLADATGTPVNTRALYALMLAALQWLFGKSLLAVSVFETFWSAALAALVFVLARQLSSLRVAIAVAILFIFSPGLIFWLPRHIDSVWPVFVLASLALINAARGGFSGRASTLLAAIAGAVGALAFLAKEMAIFLVLVPICLGIFDSRLRGWKFPAAFMLAYFVTAYGLNLLFAGLLDAQGAPAAAGNHLSALRDRIGGWTLNGLAHLAWLSLKAVKDYFIGDSRSAVSGLMPFWPVGAISLVVMLVWTVKGIATRDGGRLAVDDRNLPTLATALAFLPFAVYCGLWLFRPSQNLPFVVALFLTTGIVLQRAIDWIENRRGSASAKALLAFVTVALLAAQLAADPAMLRNFGQTNYVARVLQGKASFESSLRGSELALWIEDNRETVIDSGGLYVSDIPRQNGAYWNLDGPARFLNLPWRNTGDGIAWPYFQSHGVKPRRPALLTFNSWRAPYPQTPLFYLSRDTLEETMKTTGTSLFAITASPLGDRLLEWLRTQAEIELLATLDDDHPDTMIVRLVRFRDDAPAGLAVDRRIGGYLRYIGKTEPWRVPAMAKLTFREQLGLSIEATSDIIALETGDGSPLTWIEY